MILTEEQFDDLVEVFGPGTYFYESATYIETCKNASKEPNLHSFIRNELITEDILLDKYRSANMDGGTWTDEDLNNSILEQEELEQRVNEWLRKQQ